MFEPIPLKYILKKSKMKHKQIFIPIYDKSLHIIICDDLEKEHRDVTKLFPTTFDRYDIMGQSDQNGGNFAITINIKNCRTKHDLIGIIAHESFHITSMMFERLGIHPDPNNDEPQAYLLSYIVEQVLQVAKI